MRMTLNRMTLEHITLEHIGFVHHGFGVELPVYLLCMDKEFARGQTLCPCTAFSIYH